MITMDITLLIQIVNMIILMFLLNGVLYKPVKKILKERAERQQGMQGEISKFEKNARLRQQEVDEKMAKASGKAKAALDSTRAEAQSAGEQRLGAIKAEAEEGKNRQLTEIKAQIDSARAGLQANLDGFANDMASKILGRSL